MANTVTKLKILNERLLSIGGNVGIFALNLLAIGLVLFGGLVPVGTIFALVADYGITAKDVLISIVATVVCIYVGFGTMEVVDERLKKNG